MGVWVLLRKSTTESANSLDCCSSGSPAICGTTRWPTSGSRPRRTVALFEASSSTSALSRSSCISTFSRDPAHGDRRLDLTRGAGLDHGGHGLGGPDRTRDQATRQALPMRSRHGRARALPRRNGLLASRLLLYPPGHILRSTRPSTLVDDLLDIGITLLVIFCLSDLAFLGMMWWYGP